MLRNAQTDLESWLHSARRRPLVLRGARQVGKSTLVRMLAASEGCDLLELNLEQHSYLDKLFATLDPGRILEGICDLTGKAVGSRMLLFLDEIQAVPSALAALRYFYEQRPDLPVIAAGSLLELIMPTLDVPMPVGRIEYCHLGPLGFDEFLRALGDLELHARLSSFALGEPWSEPLHRRATAQLGRFLKVGGMPEAVAAYLEQPDLTADWRNAQGRIVDTYVDDFAKYRSRGVWVPVLQQVYRRFPATIGRKVKYADLAPDTRVEKTHQAVELLLRARVLVAAWHASPPSAPLAAHASSKVYKAYWNDVGLLERVVGGGLDAGVAAEQFVAQHLSMPRDVRQEPRLYYWLREGRSENAEVDFLIQHEIKGAGTVIPIEVKSGSSKRMLSLKLFGETYAPRLSIRFYDGLPQKEAWVSGELWSLPLYMAPYVHGLIERWGA